MLKHYLNVAELFIDKFNGVYGEVDTTETMDFGNNDWIELSVSQVERYKEQKAELENEERINLDLQYIITGIPTPEPEPTLEDLKFSKSETLKTNYQTELNKGFTFNSNLFALDDNTKINIADWNTLIEKDRKKADADQNYTRKVLGCQITDKSGNHRVILDADWDDFVIGFGVELGTLKSYYKAKYNDIQNAVNESELDIISTDFPA